MTRVALATLLLLAGMAGAQSTPNLGLSLGTDARMNGNLQTLDAAIPAAAGVVNAATVAGIDASGQTDSTLGLRQAIALTRPFNTLVIPGGIYTVQLQPDGEPMLHPHSHLTIQCEPGAIFRQLPGTVNGGNVARMVSNMDAAGVVTPLDDVTIRGCTFDANCRHDPVRCALNPGAGAPLNGLPPTELLAFLRSTHVTVTDCTFLDTGLQVPLAAYTGSAIHFDHNFFYGIGQYGLGADSIQFNGAEHFTAIGNTMVNVFEGIVPQNSSASLAKEGIGAVVTRTSDGQIVGNEITQLAANEYCQGPGVPFDCCTGEKTGTGADLCRVGFTGGGSIIVIGARITVAANVITGANSINIESGRGFPTEGIAVTGNVMTDGHANCIGLVKINAVGHDEDLHDIEISGNQCTNVASGFVYLYQSGAKSIYNITIQANHLTTSQLAGISFVYQTVGTAGSFHDITIQGNTFDDACQAGGNCGTILLNDATSPAAAQITIMGNRFRGTGRYFLWPAGPMSEWRVEDNDFISPTGAVANMGGFAGNRIEHWIRNRVFPDGMDPFTLGAPTAVIGEYISDYPITFARLTAANGLATASMGSKAWCSNCTFDATTGLCVTGGAGNAPRLAWKRSAVAGHWCCASGVANVSVLGTPTYFSLCG